MGKYREERIRRKPNRLAGISNIHIYAILIWRKRTALVNQFSIRELKSYFPSKESTLWAMRVRDLGCEKDHDPASDNSVGQHAYRHYELGGSELFPEIPQFRFFFYRYVVLFFPGNETSRENRCGQDQTIRLPGERFLPVVFDTSKDQGEPHTCNEHTPVMNDSLDEQPKTCHREIISPLPAIRPCDNS